MASDESTIALSSAIPTGPWTIYFHSPEETKWTLNTFVSLGSMKTWGQFWSIIEVLKSESFSDGMFFLMRDPAPPLWESHHHIRGGCYSFRCSKKEAPEVYLTYIIATMMNGVTHDTNNKINGISISPKRGFNIIKLWNSDSLFDKPSNLVTVSSIRDSDIIYTPFVQKKM
uniref:Eukaryotic translation initiation factor 4E n=1 Tax=viral metagenome TaxID=1070528 RepID=A0A6C0KV19_9ZZZZ